MSDDHQQMDDESQSSSKPRVIITTRHGAAAAAAASSSSGGGGGGGSAPRRQVVKTKGRGFKSDFSAEAAEDRYSGRGGEFESLDTDAAGNTDAQKSVEGWIVVVTGLHEETNEDDLYELFADHGDIKQLHLNLDRRTGYVKGYALIEYGGFKEAQSAVSSLNGHLLHDKAIVVDWAFKKAPGNSARGQRTSRGPREVRRRE